MHSLLGHLRYVTRCVNIKKKFKFTVKEIQCEQNYSERNYLALQLKPEKVNL